MKIWHGKKWNYEDKNKSVTSYSSALTLSFSRRHIPVSNGNFIWTLSFNETQDSECSRVPVVLLHGFAGGVGLWIKNLAALALSGRTVYALDLLGFGQSSRPMASSHAQEAEEMFVQSLEEWREAVGVELMIFLGHDLGGFVSTAYALTHPHRWDVEVTKHWSIRYTSIFNSEQWMTTMTWFSYMHLWILAQVFTPLNVFK